MKKSYCGRYRGVDVYANGQMIGNNWYGEYYAVIKRGASKRRMKIKESVSEALKGVIRYIDEHMEKFNTGDCK